MNNEARTVDASASLSQTSATKPTDYDVVKQDDALKPEESIVAFGDGWRFEKETITKQLTKTKFRTEIEYPRLIGKSNNALQARKFNEAMRKFISEESGGALEDVRDVEKEKSEYWRNVEEYFVLDYDIAFASNDFISVEFAVATYSWGAAHPIDYSLVFNFDLQHGKLLSLKDIFKPRSNYLSVLSGYCQSDLESRLKTENLYAVFTEYLEPKTENFETIAVTRKGLKILLGECKVTPCAAGTQSVTVPFEVVKDVLNPQSPLAKIADEV